MTEKMLTVPKKRYENYRFLALMFGLYYTIHYASEVAHKGGNWVDGVFIGVSALIMLSALLDAYDDRRRRKAASKVDA